MDIVDELTRKKLGVDEQDWQANRRNKIASYFELAFYLLASTAYVITSLYKADSNPGMATVAVILLVITSPASASILIGVFFTFFVFLLTGSAPLVRIFRNLQRFMKSVAEASKSEASPPNKALTNVQKGEAAHEPSTENEKREADPQSFEQIASTFLDRSNEAMRAAKRRPNALLFAGTSIAFLGLLFFVVTLPGAQLGAATISEVSPDHFWATTLNLLPRLLMLIFIQVLAGFFLRQYRSSMEEFRYYEAILRHRENQYMSYFLRKGSSDAKAVAKFAEELLKEQIFGRLSRGETTAMIEAQKLELNEFGALTEKLLALVKRERKTETSSKG